MKFALVHDYLKEYGGAERVLEALSEIFPDAPIYTSLYLPKFLGPHRERFANKKIKTSWFQYIPFKEKLISPLRILSPFAFQSFDFSVYDVIIVSQTGAYFPNLVKKDRSSSRSILNPQHTPLSSSLPQGERESKKRIKDEAILITYTHTPPRYLYGYKTARDWKKNKLIAVLGEIANHFLRLVDFHASENVDYFIANSEEVKARIKKFYRRDSTVIYPPVDVGKELRIKNQESRRENHMDSRLRGNDRGVEYYLTGGRLARAKGTDIIIDAFNRLNKPLKVFGRGFAGFEEELKLKAGENIEFVGEVNDEEKFELMKKAKAFLFASYDEDFGITPVEAMSVGCPVIAYKSGGVKETVIDGKTGSFYSENTTEDLVNAIKRFEKMKIKPEDCRKQAEKFSKERFQREIKKFIDKIKP